MMNSGGIICGHLFVLQYKTVSYPRLCIILKFITMVFVVVLWMRAPSCVCWPRLPTIIIIFKSPPC